MNIAVIDNCTGCGACASLCPKKCIVMREDPFGFYSPDVDSSLCIDCGVCINKCHTQRIHKDITKDSIYYALWDKDVNKRQEGSSGGFFGRIAEWVLDNEGVVYGACFDDSFRYLSHKSTDSVSLLTLKKSKYLESYMGVTIAHIIEDLKKGKTVLFCGTPCQVMGLKCAVGNKFPKLITCDFLCHGVPSQAIFNKYIDHIENKYQKNIKEVSFRSKFFGWKTYTMYIKFTDGALYTKLAKEDPYLRLFFSTKFNRTSCNGCNRVLQSEADITMGDLWHSKKLKIKDEDKGISLIAIHTENGMSLFDNVRDSFINKDLSFEDIKVVYKEKRVDDSIKPTPICNCVIEQPMLSFWEKAKLALLKNKVTRCLLYNLM